MTLLEYFNKAAFSKDDERVIRQILVAPETEQIIARAEKAAIEKRANYRQRLDSLDARHDKGIVNAGATHQAAIRAREAAEAKLLAAREEERQASAAVYAAEAAKGAEACELRQALRDSRDTRLDDFWMYLDDAKGKLRHLTRITSFALASWTGKKSMRYETNADEVSALSVALKEAMGDVEDMTLLPLTRAEVSERLTAMTHKLEPMLDGFSLPTPRLDENGAVTLNRQALKFAEVLQDNGVAEPGDLQTQPRAVQAPPPKRQSVKRVTGQQSIAATQKPASVAKKCEAYAEVTMQDGTKKIFF